MEDTQGEKTPLGTTTNTPGKADQPTNSTIDKPKKIEDKPFNNFITEDFLPALQTEFKKLNIEILQQIFKKGVRPVIGGECWVIHIEISGNRKLWLCFSSDKITSSKHIALAEGGSEPSLLESFLIDERKITLPLLLSRLLQRLNGQKWLGKN